MSLGTVYCLARWSSIFFQVSFFKGDVPFNKMKVRDTLLCAYFIVLYVEIGEKSIKVKRFVLELLNIQTIVLYLRD